MTPLGQTPYHFNGIRVHVHPGDIVTPIRPRWFDFPRRFGWRPKRVTVTTLIKPGQVLFMKADNTMIVREDEWYELRKRCELVTDEARKMTPHEQWDNQRRRIWPEAEHTEQASHVGASVVAWAGNEHEAGGTSRWIAENKHREPAT